MSGSQAGSAPRGLAQPCPATQNQFMLRNVGQTTKLPLSSKSTLESYGLVDENMNRANRAVYLIQSPTKGARHLNSHSLQHHAVYFHPGSIVFEIEKGFFPRRLKFAPKSAEQWFREVGSGTYEMIYKGKSRFSGRDAFNHGKHNYDI